MNTTTLTDRDAREMLEQVRCAKLLCGYRGKPAADADALREAMLRFLAQRALPVVG